MLRVITRSMLLCHCEEYAICEPCEVLWNAEKAHRLKVFHAYSLGLKGYPNG